ncbi:MAG: hypothetical protein JJU06_04020 [Ectothiorhodospiraceae bacterium]|nr:hypothetical protein [Ectothiorhodospiraceae bacterium]
MPATWHPGQLLPSGDWTECPETAMLTIPFRPTTHSDLKIMIRLTGFIAFALALIAMITFVIRANLDTMPEPYASCLELHRGAPGHGLGRLANMDLRLDESRSRVETLDNGERIEARIKPVAGSTGRPVTLYCERHGNEMRVTDGRGG